MTLRQTCKRQVGIVRQEKSQMMQASQDHNPNDASDVFSPPTSRWRKAREMICREGNVQGRSEVVGAPY